MEVEIDLVRAEEGAEYLGHRRRDRAVGGRVFGMVRRGQERPPARLLGRGRVAVVVTGTGPKPSAIAAVGIDRGDWPPEQVVVLGMKGGHQRVGADEVDHRCQPRSLEQADAVRGGNVAAGAVVLADHVRRAELRDSSLLSGPRAADRCTVGLNLVEGLDPLAALKRGRRVRQELVQALQDKGAHVRPPTASAAPRTAASIATRPGRAVASGTMTSH